jgi:hypothetical protein
MISLALLKLMDVAELGVDPKFEALSERLTSFWSTVSILVSLIAEKSASRAFEASFAEDISGFAPEIEAGMG